MSDKADREIRSMLDEIISDPSLPRWLRLYLRLGRPFMVWRVKRDLTTMIEDYVARLR